MHEPGTQHIIYIILLCLKIMVRQALLVSNPFFCFENCGLSAPACRPALQHSRPFLQNHEQATTLATKLAVNSSSPISPVPLLSWSMWSLECSSRCRRLLSPKHACMLGTLIRPAPPSPAVPCLLYPVQGFSRHLLRDRDRHAQFLISFLILGLTCSCG